MLIKPQNSFLFPGVLRLNFYPMVNIFILLTVLQALMFVPTLKVLRAYLKLFVVDCVYVSLCCSFLLFLICDLFYIHLITMHSFHTLRAFTETLFQVCGICLCICHNRQSLIRSFVAELLFLKLFYIFLYNFLNVFTLLHRSFK